MVRSCHFQGFDSPNKQQRSGCCSRSSLFAAFRLKALFLAIASWVQICSFFIDHSLVATLFSATKYRLHSLIDACAAWLSMLSRAYSSLSFESCLVCQRCCWRTYLRNQSDMNLLLRQLITAIKNTYVCRCAVRSRPMRKRCLKHQQPLLSRCILGGEG